MKKARVLTAVAAVGFVLAMAGAAQAGLVAYWDFDEGAGMIADDSSANDNDGILQGGDVTWVAGHTGNPGDFALNFPGASAGNNDWVDVPDDPSLHIHTPANQNFTVAGWVYDRISNYGALYCQGTAASRHMELQTQASSGAGTISIWNDTAGGPRLSFDADTAINDWTHLAVTSDGTNLTTYLNGVVSNTGAAPAGVSPGDWGSVRLGQMTRSALTHALNGYLDDVVVFDSVEDINSIMNGTHPAMILDLPDLSEFRIDLSDNSGSATGWDVFTAAGGPTPITDWSGGGDNDVTLTITSSTTGIGENNPNGGGATVIDGVGVPAEANNDYVWNNTGAGSILFEFENLDAGMYNVSVFEGRTTDANGQFGKIWVGALGGEPGSQNTDDFAGSSSTLVGLTIGAGDSLFYRHLDDNWGGTSGLIVRQTQLAAAIPEPSSAILLGLGLGGLALFGRRRRKSPSLDGPTP